MSLVGPRPLLPRDQPSDPSLRLMVRPGITGWAQVNGGKLLTSTEKNELDEWYIQNASFFLDLMDLDQDTFCNISGERRREAVSKTKTAAENKSKFDAVSKRSTT